MLSEGRVLVDVLLYSQPESWYFSCDCINCTTMVLFGFFVCLVGFCCVFSFGFVCFFLNSFGKTVLQVSNKFTF